MEPFTAVQPLVRLLGAGVRAWDTLLGQGFDPRDLQALRAPGQAGDNVVLLPNAAASDAMAHLALLIAAFGRALERKGGEAGRPPGPGLRRFLDQSEQAQMHEIELRLQRAALQMPAPGASPAPSGSAAGAAGAAGGAGGAGVEGSGANSLSAPGPLQTAWYHALRDAFSSPLPEVSGDPPLTRESLALQAFERQLMLAYWEGLHGTLGRVLGPSQNGTPPHRARFLRELLVADIADWGSRHVFGNLLPTVQGQGQGPGETGPFPFLPLAEVYTEPFAHLTGAPAEQALGLFHRILDDRKTRLVLVKGDFGLGKTLTARILAMRLANIYRDEGNPDVPYPVFVRCDEDLEGENFDLGAAVRRARKRHAEELGITLDHDDPAIGLPDPQSRVVFIVDGLNEVTLGPRWLDSLFERLRGAATERWQIVVFSRPGLLPSEDQLRSTPVVGMPVIEMLPFRGEEDATGGHLARWLEVWNRIVRRDRPPITLTDLTSRQLHRLAKTPLFLYMIAHAWERYPATARPTSQAMVFETFFQQVAHDLVSASPEQRPATERMAERTVRHLTEQLVALGEFEAGEGAGHDTDALLWLLTRVAWEAQKLVQRREPSPLTCRTVNNLLKDELRIGSDDAPLLESAILLALQQTDLRKAGDQIGDRIRISHPAFREFLVARYWADRLKKIVRARERDWPEHARKLLGGRLLGEEDRSYPLLLQIVSADAAGGGESSPLHWEYRHRKRLVEWAEDCFNDEHLVFSELRPGSGSAAGTALLREDQRAALREAALAIGSQVVGSPGLKARDTLTLRSLLAWFWLVGERPIVIAPRADLRGAVLDGARLDGARLDGARLDGARLDGAVLSRAVLSRAVLEGARLDGARLDGARLDGVNLDGGVLSRAILSHANLDGASLEGVKLDGANLRGAIYDDATHWPKDFAPAAAGAITVAIHRRRELK